MKVLRAFCARDFDTFVLDLDGTILDYRKRVYQVFASFVEQPVPFEVFLFLRFQGYSNYSIYSRLSGGTKSLREFSHEFIEFVESPEHLVLDELLPGVKEWLIKLNGMGKQALLYTARRNSVNLEIQLESLGLSNLFTDIVATNGGEKRDLYQSKEGLGTIFVSDSESDILCARGLMGVTCFVLSGLQPPPFLNAPDIALNSIVDLVID